jgi:alpha-1,2-glucosyltransferase
MFFSWPLILPYLLDAIFPPRFVPGTLRYRGLTKSLPRARVTVPLLLTMFLIVRFNTIIHPFTLADNRHYIFYVFRIFRRHYLIKYLAVPIYLSCGWLAIVALGGPATEDERIEAKNLDARGKKSNKRGALKSAPPAAAGNKVSVVIVWFVSTALSLITAPLVEPRYFIIPWIMWRLHVFPAPTDSNTRTDKPQRTSTMLSRLQYSFRNYDHRLYLETIWYLMVNFVTGYVFLYRGFSWPQEPGNVQRFIW